MEKLTKLYRVWIQSLRDMAHGSQVWVDPAVYPWAGENPDQKPMCIGRKCMIVFCVKRVENLKAINFFN